MSSAMESGCEVPNLGLSAPRMLSPAPKYVLPPALIRSASSNRYSMRTRSVLPCPAAYASPLTSTRHASSSQRCCRRYANPQRFVTGCLIDEHGAAAVAH